MARCSARGQLHTPHPDDPDDDPQTEVDNALGVWGLQIVDAGEDEEPVRVKTKKCYLWPCNVPTYNIWQRLQTQWRRAGMDNTPTGLDYTAVTAYLVDVLRTPAKQRPEIFEGLQAMECATLDEWNKQRDKAASRRA